MKRVTFLTATIAAVAIMTLAASCGEKSDTPNFKTIEVDEFVKHPNATADYEGLECKITFTYPVKHENKEILATLQSKFIEYVLGKKYASLTPEEAVKACIEEWKKGYAEDIKEFEDDDFPAYAVSYEYIYSDTILFVNDVLLQMKTNKYVYGGGAHGFSSASAHLFNLKTGTEYTQSDIFQTESQDNIRWTITSALLQYWGVEDDPEFTFEEDAVWTKETAFAISSEGIIFLYSDCDLGYFALGSPEITIPFVEIFPFLCEGTPVWEVAKQAVLNKLDKKTRTILEEKKLAIGSTLEEVLTIYPKYKLEIYYNETGSFQYASIEDLLNDYGENIFGVYNDYAIFTPLNPDETEADICFFISFRNLDNKDKCKKTSKVWFANCLNQN